MISALNSKFLETDWTILDLFWIHGCNKMQTFTHQRFIEQEISMFFDVDKSQMLYRTGTFTIRKTSPEPCIDSGT